MDGNGSAPKKELRPYQVAAKDAINNRFEQGIQRQLLSVATGGGKTEIAAFVIKERIEPESNALFIAHRDRLVTQAAERIEGIIGFGKVGLVNGNRKDWWSPVVCATVQSAGQEKQLARAPQFKTIIIDECHRSAAPQYAKVIETLLAPGGLLLGLSATPNRSDKRSLIPTVFQEVVYEIGMEQLINDGHLCRVIGAQIELPIDISKLRSQVGTDGIKDFKAEDVRRAFEQIDWMEAITAGWKEVASDRRTIVFVPPGIVDGRGCGMAHGLAEYMQLQGIQAAAVDGTTHDQEQDRIIKDFTEGRLQVLVNVNIFTEGLDIPPIDCVLFARLTQSSIVYSQSIGRGTRNFPGKENCLVIDVTGMAQSLAAQGQSLMTLGKVLPTPEQKADLMKERIAQAKRLLRKLRHADVIVTISMGRAEASGEMKESWVKQLEELNDAVVICLMEEAEREEEEERERVQREVNNKLLRHSGDEIRVRQVNMVTGLPELVWEIDKPTRMASARWNGVRYQITRPDPEGEYVVTEHDPATLFCWTQRVPTFAQAKSRVDARIAQKSKDEVKSREDRKKQAVFDDPYAPWRRKPASDKQKALATRLFIDLPAGCTAGQAKDLIDAKLAKRKKRNDVFGRAI